MSFPAHILPMKDGRQKIQTVAEHLNNTALLASKMGKPFGLEKASYLLGMVHDAGKLTNAFKDYIEKASRNEKVARGSVIHTFSGVRLILSGHAKSSRCTIDDVALEILAYASGAHHGLFDCVREDGLNEFERRLHDERPENDEGVSNYFLTIMSQDELSLLINEAVSEINVLLGICRGSCPGHKQMKFFTGLLSRFLLSILIDADRLDTADFMSNGDMIDTASTDCNWADIRTHVEAKYASFTQKAVQSPVNHARQIISATCVDRIGQLGNVIRLNIPTGSGKTITGLRAAVRLAAEKQKTHIIYTAPLLSILEQNAADIRSFIGDDSLVLEHHSNIVVTEDNEDVMHSHDLLTQNWSAPVIVTTMVQLLNTMFDGSSSSVRRFHALANSVIIIDEVQTVPKKMLTLFNLMISFLGILCGTTFILCSATQPYLEKADTPPLVTLCDLMPYDEKVWKPFNRTNIVDNGSLELSEIPTFIETMMKQHNSMLVICNKKAEASTLMNAVNLEDTKIVHLSASMCVEHRREAIKEIQTLLEEHKKVLCISTQVIEAGVDVSFECVIRLTAGMDSIVQAAGRCNRHGEIEGRSPVYILFCSDEQLTHLPDIQAGRTATNSFLNDYHACPMKYGNRLESDESIRAYYEKLYKDMDVGMQDFPIMGSKQNLYQMLSDNELWSAADPNRLKYFLTQAFKTAGTAFSVFESDGKTVIVPWKKGVEIIEALQNVQAEDIPTIKYLLEQAKPYTVTVYDYQFKTLSEIGGIITLIDGTAFALSPQYYDDQLGLSLPDNKFLEV